MSFKKYSQINGAQGNCFSFYVIVQTCSDNYLLIFPLALDKLKKAKPQDCIDLYHTASILVMYLVSNNNNECS